MLQKLICKLNTSISPIQTPFPGDALQAVLMERIAPAYASDLHTQGLKPYSQYVRGGRNGLFWIVSTLTEEAARGIIEPLSSLDFSAFHLNRTGRNFLISEKTQISLPLPDLINRFYFGESENIFRLRFLTPTAFKSNGAYIFYPDLRLVFGSLMQKYSFFCEDGGRDDDVLEALVSSAKIVRYDLKSVYTDIERVRLPAFSGMISIKVSGPRTLVNYLNLLLRFGEYAGVGVKCAMGMGAMEVLDRPGAKEKGDRNIG